MNRDSSREGRGDRPNHSAEDRPNHGATKRPNHLVHETSPYLLQHAYNPVDWYPWGNEALEKARRENKPIFLSIGYSSCHWCHVMAHESFEDRTIAAYLNEHFVSIKVDREERPDLDEIYMSAVQLLSGQGGWPLSVWLTPDRKPFFGGTYYPPGDRYGHPGFRKVLERVADVYKNRRDDLEAAARNITDTIASFGRMEGGAGLLAASVLEGCVDSLRKTFDPEHGGFSQAPKFPHSMGIQLLLRHYLRTGDLELRRMATVTLDRMAEGGIYDHLGGGFHRYSTDARWLVPHFEKMLYDQALLAVSYLEAFQVTGNPLYKQVVEETLDYVLRDMTSPEGAFYSSRDADSEGVEGLYYLWTPAEIEDVLGAEDARVFCRAYDVEEPGNFEGKSILHRAADAGAMAAYTGRSAAECEEVLARARPKLLARRQGRIPPGRDEKIVAAWNGLMASAFARAGRALGSARHVEAAARACDFMLSRMQQDGRPMRVYKDGRARFPGYLEDYADLVAALTDLYEATFDLRWLAEAVRLADLMVREFHDQTGGGFYNTSGLHPDLIVRVKNAQDGSTPSGNSMAAHALLRLGRLSGRIDLEKRGEETIRAFDRWLEQAPGAFHQMMLALDLHLGPRQEIVIAGPQGNPLTAALREAAWRRFLPRAVLAAADGQDGDGRPEGTGGSGGTASLLEGKVMIEGRPAAYVCHDYVCDLPVTTVEDLERVLG